MRQLRLLGLTLGMLLSVAQAAPAGSPPPPPGYKVTKRIALGGDGFWDCLTVDSAAHRLYVSHSTQVEVVDTQGDTLVGEIKNTAGVHAIALAPELGRGFTSNGRDSTVTIFDLKTLATLGTIPVRGRNPDLIVFDPVTKRVFTMNGGSHTATAIDAATGSVIDTLQLGGKPEFAVADGRGHIYVNLEDKSAIVSFDTRALTLGPRWPLAPGEEPSGLAYDAAHRRLFAGCGNKLMVIVDADSGRVVGTVPVGDGVDGAAFDPTSGLAFTPNGEGSLTVVREESPERFRVVETVETQKGGRTMALDATSHRIYIPTAELGPPPAPTADRPHPRPTIIPGTFTILVLEPKR
jgi:YVTN family beta-propeller protein